MQKTQIKKRKNVLRSAFAGSRTKEKGMKKHFRGEITIYLTLTVPILLSLFLSAFEAAKISAYRVVTDCALRSAIISAFGEYHKELAEQYDLFFIDLSYLTDSASLMNLATKVEERMEENLNPREERLLYARGFFGESDAKVEIESAARATDFLGSELKKQAVYYMKDFVSADFIRDMQSLIRIKESYDLDEKTFDSAVNETSSQQTQIGNSQISKGASEEEVKNIKATSSSDIQFLFVTPLDMMVHKGGMAGVSRQTFNPFDVPSTRKEILSFGNGNYEDILADPSAGIFFNEYVMKKCGNYVHPKEDSYLKYQAEYIFVGSSSDSMNLSMTLHNVFAIRTAANALSIKQDKQKMAVIDVIATALGAVTRVPEKVYEATIILIWAAAESTYDVEDLLNGKKIALIKDGKDFHTSLKGSVSSLTDNACDYSNLLSDSQRKQLPAQTDIGTGNGAASVGSKIKLSYEDYLRLLLMSVPGPVKTLRMMDIMELDIRKTKDNDTFRIDQCVDEAVFVVSVTDESGTQYDLRRNYCY